ncbi:MAG TPA: DNA cytosine methyltransferase [Bacteroidia bacterium]|nr:DNA cytosine methyltransferase [Bacteroidia bacterium]
MAQHGKSGRIVVDVPPELKRRLYSTLALSGSTLKEWFVQEAERICSVQSIAESISTHSAAVTVVREDKVEYRVSRSRNPLANPEKHSLVSMFSGCGGMDLGFKGGFEVFGRRYRSLPFEVSWANDLNAEACKTYERNLMHPIHCGDVWTLIDSLPEKTDVLIGGFPCQDISVNGKRTGVNGARSGLYKAMIEAIRITRPKVFVAENVKALLRHEEWLNQVVTDFKSLGYNLHFQLYRAADYGVPQTRERVLFVGTAPEIRPYTPPQPERNASNWMTAREAIADLEELDASPQFNHIWSGANISPEQGNRRLIADRPGYTIRAECHGNIQFHYRLPRRISMREAARIQSFPDKFIFMSGLRQIERQVGNAVPPVLAWHVANSVLECLE